MHNRCRIHSLILHMFSQAGCRGETKQHLNCNCVNHLGVCTAFLWLVRLLILLPCLKVIANRSLTKAHPPWGSVLYHTAQSGRWLHMFSRALYCRFIHAKQTEKCVHTCTSTPKQQTWALWRAMASSNVQKERLVLCQYPNPSSN